MTKINIIKNNGISLDEMNEMLAGFGSEILDNELFVVEFDDANATLVALGVDTGVAADVDSSLVETMEEMLELIREC